jgi:hypothetical protein
MAATGDEGDAGGFAQGAMRIGDTERTSALDALAEHLTDGRITLDEYGERSARVSVSKTVGDLVDVFDDLPAPHPVIQAPGSAPARVVASQPVRATTSGGTAPAADRRSRAQKIVAAAASASAFVALALFFTTGSWLWFLLIPAISGIAQALWGADWREPDQRRPRELPGSGRE